MQVYRGIPTLTNQHRRRHAELVGVVPVSEEWTVARHKEAVEDIVDGLDVPFVLDAGTGMYLNTIVLDVPLAPKAPEAVRVQAQRLAEGAHDPRRAAREAELRLMGSPERGSIWSGRLRYEAAFVYLRPPRTVLDENIARRTASIVRGGLDEARELLAQEAAGRPPNYSVRDAVGVKEMMLLASGAISREEAHERIYVRTRRLARRQMRWFDKLVKSLGDDRFLVAENSSQAAGAVRNSHIMHDIIGS
jgi:tRNA dimethylallyltransferase